MSNIFLFPRTIQIKGEYCNLGCKTVACQMASQTEELTHKNIWIAKQKGQWQAKIFLDSQNKF